MQVEIWPTSMVFKKGHRIRLDIQPRDGVGSASYMHYHADYNSGTNTVHAGGDRPSYLLLPVIPAGGASMFRCGWTEDYPHTYVTGLTSSQEGAATRVDCRVKPGNDDRG